MDSKVPTGFFIALRWRFDAAGIRERFEDLSLSLSKGRVQGPWHSNVNSQHSRLQLWL